MKKMIVFLMTVLLVVSMTACSGSALQAATQSSTAQEAQSTATVETSGSTGAGESSAAITETSVTTTSVDEALAENGETHESATDVQVDSAAAVAITLNGDSISAGEGVTVSGSLATITKAGTYSLSGTLNDGQIVVDTEDEDTVQLILNGVSLNSATGSPLAVLNAETVVIYLVEGSQNSVTDAASYVFPSADVDEPNAAIFASSDLTITGSGALTVTGNYNDGIASKDGLILSGGVITVTAADDGIRGKDYLVMRDSQVTVTAQGDGLKADNEEDATLGYISIESGALNITAGGDGIAAQTDVLVASGELNIVSGGGSSSFIDETLSAKGIKGLVSVDIDGGTFNINSADDAVHSNDSIIINAGDFTIASGDDGMHADTALTINGGNINITQSYEGIESAVITLNDGTIHLVASDDGVNVAGGADSSGMNFGPGGRMRPGSQENFTYTGDNYLYIHGSYLVVDAAGDGIDVNGAIEMTDGVVLVNGPTEQMNGALDYDGTFTITGGFFVAAGSSGMAQAPGAASGQNSLMLFFSSTQAAGSLVHVQNSAGEEILTFAPTRQYQSLAFSSPDLVQGETYSIYVGGSSSGENVDGLYQGGAYTPGSEYTSFTISSVVTQIGSGGGGGRFR